MSTGVSVEGGPVQIERQRLPIYIDKVANALRLNVQYRAELHAFKELVLDLPPYLWRTTIYQQASIYRSLQLNEEAQESVAGVKADIKVVSSQFSKQFVLSVEQREDIITLCKAMVIDGTRVEYDYADEALAKLRNQEAFPRLVEPFKSKANTKTILRFVRNQASYTRNAYRRMLRDSVFGTPTRSSLTTCARQATHKFSNSEEPSVDLILRVAILRDFIRRNPELVNRGENAPDAAPPRPRDENADSQSTLESQSSGAHGRKRKNHRATVHFWGAFTEFLQEKNQLWGIDKRSSGWVSHIEQCLAEERRLYPEDRLSRISHRAPSVPGLQQVIAESGSRSGSTLEGTSTGGFPSAPFTFTFPPPPSHATPQNTGHVTPAPRIQQVGAASTPPLRDWSPAHSLSYTSVRRTLSPSTRFVSPSPSPELELPMLPPPPFAGHSSVTSAAPLSSVADHSGMPASQSMPPTFPSAAVSYAPAGEQLPGSGHVGGNHGEHISLRDGSGWQSYAHRSSSSRPVHAPQRSFDSCGSFDHGPTRPSGPSQRTGQSTIAGSTPGTHVALTDILNPTSNVYGSSYTARHDPAAASSQPVSEASSSAQGVSYSI